MRTFLTIGSPGEGLYREKGSKFLAYAYPVDSEDVIRECLEALKKAHPKARHHCYAWRLGADKTHYRYNDAGEPTNSAGPPIYGQIKSLDLSNVLVVVVRYFGGTKLGVGGLIQAYRLAAEDALKNCILVEDHERAELIAELPYASLSAVMNFIKARNVTLKGEEYAETCRLVISLPADEAEAFKQGAGLQIPGIEWI